MIAPDQVAGALERIDPRDREFGEPEARSAPAGPRAAESAFPEPEPEPNSSRPPATVWAIGEHRRRRVPHLALALFGLGLAALGAALGLIAINGLGGDGQAAGGGADSGDGTRIFLRAREGPAAAPLPSDPDASCYPRAHAGGRTMLYAKPGGEGLERVPGRTEWGTPRVFGVIAREGDWLAVQTPELDNQTIAWMRVEAGRVDCVRWSLHAELTRRALYARGGGHTERSFAVGIGRRGNPTPEGRFAVTDKLRVTDADSPYGCCVIALTGHQTRLPASWPGGDRLAVHATTDLASIGRPATLGCMRVRTGESRSLIERIPVGTPIFVSS